MLGFSGPRRLWHRAFSAMNAMLETRVETAARPHGYVHLIFKYKSCFCSVQLTPVQYPCPVSTPGSQSSPVQTISPKAYLSSFDQSNQGPLVQFTPIQPRPTCSGHTSPAKAHLFRSHQSSQGPLVQVTPIQPGPTCSGHTNPAKAYLFRSRQSSQSPLVQITPIQPRPTCSGHTNPATAQLSISDQFNQGPVAQSSQCQSPLQNSPDQTTSHSTGCPGLSSSEQDLGINTFGK